MTTTDPLKLGAALYRAAAGEGHGRDLFIPLTALAWHCLMLGAGDQVRREQSAHLATLPDGATRIALCLQALGSELVDQELVSPAEGVRGPTWAAALHACMEVCSDADLATMSEHHDVLGEVYSVLRGGGDLAHFQAHYTPLEVGKIQAAITAPERWHIGGGSVHDPCCGTGGLLIAMAMVMRERGWDPALCRWTGQDIDGLAGALCEVNLVYRGMVTKEGTAHIRAYELLIGVSRDPISSTT